ncbi:uncharacterized protein LOC9633936 [Selaginella moellendorffii]|uniref:uncharacterized protein LOC9633936 n=1 Tax=Selaginella moellendorffii TaxID=88036 RepID=UPI000D1C84B9|nr:uncharacterized protein LOC9633936 [Selaginella moellendorffii]|eukprot:XP_024542604.1 uncharacterized protein LOC9633936 [Selaginella moellendorffii]
MDKSNARVPAILRELDRAQLTPTPRVVSKLASKSPLGCSESEHRTFDPLRGISRQYPDRAFSVKNKSAVVRALGFRRESARFRRESARRLATMSTHTATPDPVVCRHFQRGNCRFGLHCKFLHQQVADPVSSPLQSNHNVHTSQTMLTRTATSGLRILETIANTEGPLSTAPRVRAMPSSSSSEQQGNGDKGVLQEGETESASPAQAEETEKKFREDILRYTTLLERKTHRGVSVPSCSLALLVEHIKRCSDISLASKSWLYSMIDNIPIKPCSASEQSECHLNEEEALLHYSRFTDEALSMLPNEQHKALADLHISINKVKKPTEVCVAPALVQPHRRRPRKVKKVKKVKVTEAEEEAYFSCEELFEEDATRLGLRLLHLQLVAEYVTFMAVTMYSYIKLKTARVNPLLDKLEAIKKELKKAVQDL